MAKAKEQKETFEEVLERLNKKYNQVKEENYFVSTGSIKLDLALGGGVSSGRITELVAWEGAGKTTLALHIVAEVQKMGITPAYIDAEHALSEKYARAIGVDWDKLKPTIFQPMNGEESFDYAGELIKTGVVKLIVFDSTAGMIPAKQLEDPAGQSHLGLHARLFSAEIPKLNSLASLHNVVILFISQVREKIGVLFGSPETTQAGNALKFFASNRIELRRSMNKTSDGKEVINQTTKFKTIKCKTNSPFLTGSFDITFGEGIDQTAELVDVAVTMDIISKSGSWYSYGEHKIGQGSDSVKNFLEDNPEFAQEIKEKVLKGTYQSEDPIAE